MRRLVVVLLAIAAVVALPAGAATPKLLVTFGPGFTITLKKGKYSFVCDPHASTMHGTFRIR